MESCSEGTLKIGEINCIITFKIFIQIFLKRFYIKRVLTRYNFVVALPLTNWLRKAVTIKLCQVTFWLCGHMTNYKFLYLLFRNTYGHHNWQSSNLR